MITLGQFIESSFEVLIILLIFVLQGIILDKYHENAYRRCKKKCETAKCREWLCKYYHEPRKEN